MIFSTHINASRALPFRGSRDFLPAFARGS
jgi:hypothetical protein